jgi:MarR family transcriptional regulator, negative regulator of the multidrug operon emrRAB
VTATPRDRPRGLLINTWIASELVAALLDRNLAEDGIDAPFYGTLSVLGVWGPLTPTEVAERTGTPLTTVSDRLRRMVADGNVERVAHPDDGRSHHVRLTEAGDARWRQGWPALQRTIAQVEANLTRPVEDVLDTLEDLIEALRTASQVTPAS